MKLDAMTIGEKIRLLRIAHGMTQKELGKAAKVEYRMISHWELGKHTPSAHSREKLGRVLGKEMKDTFVDRKQRLADARDEAVECAIALLRSKKLTPAELNAASNTIRSAAEVAARTAAARSHEEFRELMRGSRERLLRKLDALRSQLAGAAGGDSKTPSEPDASPRV